MSERGWVDRPRIKARDYGLPMICPKPGCEFRWLKLPGVKMRPCPNDGTALVSMRPKRKPVRTSTDRHGGQAEG